MPVALGPFHPRRHSGRRRETDRTRPRKEFAMAMADNRNIGRDSNPDPITGAPGAHPIGTGVGAAGAGAAGAAIGAVAGPVGAAVGAVVGAVAGGLAGKGVAEAVNPTEEDAYWRGQQAPRPDPPPRPAH